MIERREYLKKLAAFREKDIIKVVTGVRRCGKSTLFRHYIDWLRSTGVTDERIISINLDDVANEGLLNYRRLHEYVSERLCRNGCTYVFLDEVQNCPEFERAVDSLFIKPNVDVYITGSNAWLLSGELATLLSGRYVAIEMLPFSFAEFRETRDEAARPLDASFNDYLRFGSFPYVASLERDAAGTEPYLEGIYNTILVKDAARRTGISDISVLEGVVRFLADNIGSPVSTKKISDAINSSGRKISANTVDNYVRALTDSYIFYKADRYDIRGKQHLKTLSKYYIVDTGIRNLLLSASSPDTGHVLENVVYLELRRRGYRVSVGRLAENEVDFVASDMNGVSYFQVCASVLDENTLKRELAPLRQINDNYPKTLLTLDVIGAGANYSGIVQRNLAEWLLER